MYALCQFWFCCECCEHYIALCGIVRSFINSINAIIRLHQWHSECTHCVKQTSQSMWRRRRRKNYMIECCGTCATSRSSSYSSSQEDEIVLTNAPMPDTKTISIFVRRRSAKNWPTVHSCIPTTKTPNKERKKKYVKSKIFERHNHAPATNEMAECLNDDDDP